VADTGGLSPRSLRPHLLRLAHLLRAVGQAGPGGPLAARVATWDVWRAGRAAPPARRSPESPVVLACLRPEQQRRPWISLPRPIDADRLRAAAVVWELGAGARAALDVVGRHPFLPTFALGQVLGRDVRWARERRAELMWRGLVQVVPHQGIAGGRPGQDGCSAGVDGAWCVSRGSPMLYQKNRRLAKLRWKTVKTWGSCL
jgi:hypothetical protein